MARVEFNESEEEANSLRGWSLHFNHWRYTTDIISPITQRFHFHVFTLPTLRSETLHPDSECLSCEVYTRFHITFLENHWPLFIGMICVVKGIERGWWMVVRVFKQ